MDKKVILSALIILLFAGTALAVGVVTPVSNAECNWSPAVAPVDISGKAGAGVVNFTWTHDKGDDPEDFNNFILKVDGSRTANSVGDFNMQTGSSYTAVNVHPGDTVTLFVQAFDGNVNSVTGNIDFNCGADSNKAVTIPTVLGAGQYLIYSIFIGFAVVFGLILLVAIVGIVLGVFNLKGIIGGGKR